MKSINKTKNILILFMVFSLLVQGFIIPVQAAGINPYETFSTGLADDYFTKPEWTLRLESVGAGNVRDGAWICFKNMDFGKEGPYMVDIYYRVPAGYAEYVELRLDSPTGDLVATVPVAPSTQFGVVSKEPGKALIDKKITGVHDLYLCVPKSTADLGTMTFYEKASKKFKYERYIEKEIFTDVTDKNLKYAIDVLSQLGIIDSEKSDKYRPDMNATRAEFAQAVYRMYVERPEKNPLTGLVDEEPKPDVYTPFDDVAGDSDYAEAIAYLSEKGIMNGISETMFYPNIYISYVDAVTVLVRMLGMKAFAEMNGGYPNGYIMIANREKIIPENIGADEYLGRDDMAFLLENVVKAEYLDQDTFTSDGYVNYVKKDGILGLTRGVYCGSGKVMATPTTRLHLPGSNLDLDQVKIDDFEYHIGETNASSLIGMEVDYWYTEKNGERTLNAIVPRVGTDIVMLDSRIDNIYSISNDQIVYAEKGKNKEKVFDIDKNSSVIYNGVAADADIEELVDNEKSFKGFVNIVENRDGSKVVLIEEYTDLTIESVDVSLGTIVASKIKSDKNNIKIEASSDKNYVIIEDGSKQELKLKQLKTGDIISTYQSKNKSGKQLVRIFYTDKFIEGSINEIDSEGNIYIDGKKYVFSNRYEGPKTVGVQRRFYLNVYGDVFKSEALEGVPRVGLYFGHSRKNDGFDSTVEIKIMTTETESTIYPVSEKVKIDGMKFRDITSVLNGSGAWIGIDELKTETPVRYKVNSAGEIIMIDTPGIATDDPDDTLIKLPGTYKDLYYHKNASCLADGNDGYKMVFYCPPSAIAFAFYANEGAPIKEREKYCVSGKVDEVLTIAGWQISGGAYSTTGNERVADLVIDSDKKEEYGADAPLVVKEVSTKLDSNGEIVNIITGVSSKGNVEYILSEDFMNSTHQGVWTRDIIESLVMGDIVSFKVLSGNIPRVLEKVVMYRDGKSSHTFLSTDGNKEISIGAAIYEGNQSVGGSSRYETAAYKYGKVTEKNKDYILLDVGRGMDELITLGGNNVTEIYKRDDGAEFLKTGQSPAIIEETDRVFACVSSASISQIVVYKNIEAE